MLPLIPVDFNLRHDKLHGLLGREHFQNTEKVKKSGLAGCIICNWADVVVPSKFPTSIPSSFHTYWITCQCQNTALSFVNHQKIDLWHLESPQISARTPGGRCAKARDCRSRLKRMTGKEHTLCICEVWAHSCRQRFYRSHPQPKAPSSTVPNIGNHSCR